VRPPTGLDVKPGETAAAIAELFCRLDPVPPGRYIRSNIALDPARIGAHGEVAMSTTELTRPIGTGAQRHARMLIDGAWVDSASGAVLDVENPARRTTIASIPRGGEEDVDRAAKAAAKAFPDWKKVAPRQRGRLLLRIAEALEARIEELARVIAEETGNALRTQARPEATLSADIFRYFGGLAGELKGETIPLGEQVLSYTRREPLGVVGAIIPWNAPVLLAALKIAPALCAGNTMVLKTAEDAPLGVLLIAEVCQQFLPPGVLNVLTGTGEECGGPLARHPIIRKLSFTGSTEVGKIIMRAAADRIVPVSLELGGKSPSIVYPDVDEDWVVDGVIAGMRFTRQSQSCTAGSRLFLHADIFDSFLEKLSRKTQALTLGDPLDEASDIGSIINEKQFRKVCGYIDEGLKRQDARLVFGGLPPTEGPLSEGYFAIPTVFADTSNDWRLAREEIFGPVLVAIPWRDESEAIRMANDSHYGLAAYVWTREIGSALRAAHAIESGWVQVNQGLGQQPGHSYGGYKQSGIGREFSLEGMLDSFTQRKNVTVNLNVPRRG
jgi:acyl-CoA reductase-like NAD-dependent aldehyde dehydrogenase